MLSEGVILYRGRRCILFAFLALALAPLVLAQQTGSATSLETAQQANARLEQLAGTVGQRPVQMDALIGPGDLVHIEVFDVPDLSRDVRVSMSGDISLPLVSDPLHVGGLTPFQAQDAIADALKRDGLVTHPQVSVLMREQHGMSISVVGAVQKPGVIQETRPMSVLEALAMAGGLAADAGSEVLITRHAPELGMAETTTKKDAAPGTPAAPSAATPTAVTLTVDLNHLLETGDPQYNVPVYGGDILTVPHAGIVYVGGAVMQPGGFTLPNSQDHMSIIRVLALAHGTTLTAKMNDSVILRKTSNGKTEQINVHLKDILSQKAADEPLYANDVLFIPDSTSKRALYKAANVAMSVTTGVLVFRGTQ